MKISNTPPPAVVHIVDDDAGLRVALANLLRSAGQTVAVYDSPEAFLARPAPDAPGCLLLDIKFPDADGLDFQASLHGEPLAMPVILMTGHADVPSSVRGMKAGAVDFLTKPFDEAVLLEAVAAALARDLDLRQARLEASDALERFASLTQREVEVLGHVVAGLMNKQIAGELDLSEITVKVHRGTMMRKMGVRTVPDLVRLAAWLPLPA